MAGDPGGPAFSGPVSPPPRINPEEFRSLYLRLRPSLEAQARRFFNGQQEIEDVVQETLLRVYQAAIDVGSDAHALAYARRVLTNLCIDRFRAAGRHPTVISLEGSLAHELPDDTDNSDTVLKAEDACVVRAALTHLTPAHREALIKREVEEKPISTIADELGVPVESVKHLLFRARRSLRRLLADTQVAPGVDLDRVGQVHLQPENGFNAAVPLVILSLIALSIGSTLSGTCTPAPAHHAHTFHGSRSASPRPVKTVDV